MTKQMINHRSPEFGDIIDNITDKLKKVFQTKNDILILSSSGTGSMEAVIVNSLSPGLAPLGNGLAILPSSLVPM